MRHRTDNNHKQVKAAFEKFGCAVLDLSQVGGGCPDLLVGCSGSDYLVEVKFDKGKISESQREFARRWPAPIYVCRTMEGVADLVCVWMDDDGDGEIDLIESLKAGKPIRHKVDKAIR